MVANFKALWWKRKTVSEPEVYFVPHVSDTSTTILIPLVPTPTHVPLSHTFTYGHHLPVPLLELSAICVDTERHASCVRAAELGLAVSSERPLDAPTSPVRTKMHSHYVDIRSPPHKGSLAVLPPYPSPPTSSDSPRLTAAQTQFLRAHSITVSH